MEPVIKVEESGSDEFVKLRCVCKGLPDKVISVLVDAIIDGKTTIEQEIEKAKADTQRRAQRAQTIKDILNGHSTSDG